MRADLLVLTADDLTAFSNRGLARRAEQEAASGALDYAITESPEGTVTVRWSDGVECTLPAGARLAESRCSCPSTTLCRHVLRSVFAYQKHHASGTLAEAPRNQGDLPLVAAHAPAAQGAIPAPAPWNPKSITDAELARFFSAAEFERWQREFSNGHVIQVWTGAKPRAVLHTLGCTVNFLVPDDARYAVCDCAAEAPCGHAALAVWAFRGLPADQVSGLISTVPDAPPAPLELIREIEHELLLLAGSGLARAPSLQVDRWRRLSKRARAEALIWPSEVLHDIAELHAAYLAHDARFDPRELLSLIAELLQRLDAIRTNRTPVPALFVRGTAHDRETEFGSARLIGLGCTVRSSRAGAELAAHLQDSDSGAVVSITRFFPSPPQGSNQPARERAFGDLARTIVLKGASIAALGRSQLLVKGGRRTPSGRFIAGRAPTSVTPQAYAWENLRPPLRLEGFDQLREQLRESPPAVLGPRQQATHLTVLPLVSASDVEFIDSRQEIVARLTDPLGASAWLVHPYFSRNAGGSERLLRALRSTPTAVRFVCAQATMAGTELVLSPLSVVFEEAGRRTSVMPWVDDDPDAPEGRTTLGTKVSTSGHVDPIHDYLEELLDLLAESWLAGPQSTAHSWPRLAELGSSLGFGRLASFKGIMEPAGLLEYSVLADFAHREFSRLSQ